MRDDIVRGAVILVETVKTHLGHLLAKTQYNTREELARLWTARCGRRWSILSMLALSRLAAATVVTAVVGVTVTGAVLTLSHRGQPQPRSATSAVCRESPIVSTATQALTGAVIMDRTGGAVIARMPTLVAGQEAKVLWRPQNGYAAPTLQLTAERLNAPATTVQWTLLHATLDQAGTIDGGYPSGIAVPAAGCWQFTAHVGSTAAVVIVRVS